MHELHSFLLIATRHLRRPIRSTLAFEPVLPIDVKMQRSTSTYATFDSLQYGAVYFRGALPLEQELSTHGVGDFSWGGGGPVSYEAIAHILIPRFFSQEMLMRVSAADGKDAGESWNEWEHEQDIDGLSNLLEKAGIEHHLSQHVLEIKRF